MKRTLTALAAFALSFLFLAAAGFWSGILAGPQPDALPPSPVSLSNPDGQQLILEKYDLRVAVHGPLALTEMEMRFRNPQHRRMEGRFLYLLPPGATISRFAKEVNGKLMEGEVVERQRARSVYRQILHTMRDPALLEQDQGNRFRARVFPIPANGTVRLLLSYSQLLPAKDDVRTLSIPMAGMPKIGEFTFRATIRSWPGMTLRKSSAKDFHAADDAGAAGGAGGVTVLRRHEKDFTPRKDIELAFAAAPGAPRARTLKAGNFQMLSFRPNLTRPQLAEKTDSGWVFYFDTSASNADSEARRLEAIAKLMPRLAGNAWSARAFDLDVTKPLAKSQPGKRYRVRPDAVLLHRLKARHALGATDLAKALQHIGEQARKEKQAQRFVLVSDGIATWGPTKAREVLAALGDWPANDVLHALVLGSKQDQRMLSAIVEHTRGRIVTLPLNEGLASAVERAVAELRAPLGETFEFYDEGAEWIYPKRFQDVRPGQELIVFSRLKDGATAKPGVVRRAPDGKVAKDEVFQQTPGKAPGFAPLLQRQAYKAYLAHLGKRETKEKDAKKRAALRKERIKVSVKNRVLCPLTSLLVLETERDYRRFGIDRNALSEILVVGPSGIELKHRTAADVPVAVAVAVAVAVRKAGKKDEAEGKAKAPAKKARQARAAKGFAQGLVAASRRDRNRNAFMAEVEEKDLDDRAVANPFAAAPASGGRLRRSVRGGGTVAHEEARAQQNAPAAAARARQPAASPPVRAQDRAARAARADAPAEQRAPAPPVKKVRRPAWIKQFNVKPGAAELNALQAKIAAQPRDRRKRNDYAEALAKSGKWDALQAECFEWLPFDPENPQVFEFLGNSAAHLEDPATALRAYTSIVEVAPSSAALLHRAGVLLLTAKKYALAERLFRKALQERRDNPNIHRGLMLSLWLAGKYGEAASVAEDAMAKKFNGRYGDVKRVLREELGYILRGWMKKAPDQAEKIEVRAARAGVKLKRRDALRVTLSWETDANDVDLHVVDPNSEECFYSHKKNRSGLELYSDQTQGLGPEVIRVGKTLAGLYHIGVKYYNAGPMGTSRGVVVVFRPGKDGIVEQPEILPFTLVPRGQGVRHLQAVEF